MKDPLETTEFIMTGKITLPSQYHPSAFFFGCMSVIHQKFIEHVETVNQQY